MSANSVLWASSYSKGTVFKSVDNGYHWSKFPQISANEHIYAFTSLNGSNQLFFCTDEYLYRSTNNGETWGYTSSPIFVSVLKTSSGSILGFTRNDGIYLYNDITNTWSIIENYNQMSEVSSARINSKDEIILIGNEGRLYLSDDLGATWLKIFDEFMASRFLIAENDILYVSNNTSIYKSNENYTEWRLINGDDGPGLFETMTLKNNKTLFVGTRYDGIFYYTQNDSSETVTETKLFRNYPNPFGSSTTIEFQIKESSLVLLDIFDLLGRKVKTITNENFEKGKHKITYTPKELSSGVYIYRIQIGNESFAQKMIHIK